MTNAPHLPVIIHETEFQRQHTRLTLPSTARIGDAPYSVKNISAGGLALAPQDIADISEITPGAVLNVTLTFPFDDFSLDMDIKARLRHIDRQSSTLGLSFAGINKARLLILSHILRNYISGAYIAGDGVLLSALRADTLRVQGDNDNTKQNPLSLRGKILSALAIATLGLGALFFIGGNIYQSVFLLKSSSAFVTANAITLRAPADGDLHFAPALNTYLRKGDLVATIALNKIISPCDCYIKADDLQTVTNGQAIATLIPLTMKPRLVAELAADKVSALKTDRPVDIRIAGTPAPLQGHIDSIQYAALPVPHAVVTVTPDLSLPVEFTGRPARLTFRRF